MWKWYWSRPRAERWILVACAVFAPIELTAKAISHTAAYGDFNVHRDFGKRFLDGTSLYRGGHCFNYMPISAMYYSPLALVPPPVASLLRTGLAMICLVYCMHTLGTMIRGRARSGPWPGLAVAACGVLLCGQYVLRDFDDGGPHLIYLAMILAAMQGMRQGREAWPAVGFGLAIALKMTPGLFLPFFIWKRRWRLALFTTIATAAWIALPAVWMGPGSWWQHQDQWNRLALDVFSSRMDRARQINEVRVQNRRSSRRWPASWSRIPPATRSRSTTRSTSRCCTSTRSWPTASRRWRAWRCSAGWPGGRGGGGWAGMTRGSRWRWRRSWS